MRSKNPTLGHKFDCSVLEQQGARRLRLRRPCKYSFDRVSLELFIEDRLDAFWRHRRTFDQEQVVLDGTIQYDVLQRSRSASMLVAIQDHAHGPVE